MSSTIKCRSCKERFPDRLFAPLCINGVTLNRLCPICACEMRNMVAGFPPGTPFSGENASAMYDEALAILEQRQEAADEAAR